MFCESHELLKTLCQIWFFNHISFVWAFLDMYLWDLIKYFICEKNFMSFGYVLREIQVSKVLTLVLKLVSFESDNSLWSSSIKLKNLIDIKNTFNVSPKISKILEVLKASCKSFCFQVLVWGDFKEVARSFILRS